MEIVERFSERNIQYLDSLTCDEICSYMSANMNPNDKKKNYKKIKQLCKQHIKARYEIKRLYTYSFKHQDKHEGRLFDGSSIQGIPKIIRGFLCKGLTTDIDQNNSHPTILKYLCDKHNIPCPNLTYYINNRDMILNDMNMSREDAKTLFLCSVNKDKLNRKEKNETFKAFDKEVKIIQNKLLNLDEYKYLLDCIPLDKKYNKNGSAINRLLCKYENEILNTMINVIRNKNIEVHSLMFDGLIIYGDYYNDDTLLNDIKREVNNKYEGLNMCFSYKKHNEDIVMPKHFEANDAENLINKLKDDPLFYDNYKLKFEKTHAKIKSKSQFVGYNNYTNSYQYYKKQNIIDSYEHIKVKVIKQDKKTDDYEISEVPFIQMWLKDSNIKCYDDIDIIPPPLKCPSNIFNLWTGYDMEKIENYEKDEEAIEFFKNHIKIMCNHEEEIYDYILKWISQMIQYPGVKPGVVPTFIARQGAGKGSIFNLLEKLMGKSKTLHSETPSQNVWGKFNGLMINAILVNLDELKKKEFNGSDDVYKSLVTEPTININQKGQKQYTTQSFHRLLNTTNNGDAIYFPKDNRRDIVILSSNELIGKTDYFNRFYEYLNNIDAMKSVFEYFKTIPNMDKFRNIKKPKTKYQEDMEEESIDPIELWLRDYIKNNYKESEIEVNKILLYNLFNEFIKKYYPEHKYSKTSFGKKLIALNVDGIEEKRTSVKRYVLINIDVVMKYFKMNKEECMLDVLENQSDSDNDSDDDSLLY
jgi:hypothetical protein